MIARTLSRSRCYGRSAGGGGGVALCGVALCGVALCGVALCGSHWNNVSAGYKLEVVVDWLAGQSVLLGELGE
ncbi:hypothetical protein RRG08_035753 [Elysia crispata]|uniref:Uncharacterized protein n=1 Tax=Elysia crispata TaxID=231223 RepID=A0AAE0ZM49_9GAST|nr:hypothetical protein RRG08_035753 [Elysia crispata]